MKRLLLIALFLIPGLAAAQVNTKIQKGYVRMQSFVNKAGKRVVGARIQQLGNEDHVYSLSTPEEGYFELSLKNTDASDVYHISSVKGPKGTQYRVLYPKPNDILEFTSNAPLTIVMQSNKEIHEYATYVKKMAIEEANKNFEAEKTRLQLECEKGLINSIEKDSIIESLRSKLNNYENIVYDYIREGLQNWDFELLDERHKKISIAMENGNYSLADSLLSWRTDDERWEEYSNAVKNNEEAQKIAAHTNEIVIKTRNGILFEKKKIIELALQELDFDKAVYHMKNSLCYDSTNIDFLCGIGEMYEIHYNNYREALSYYQEAMKYAFDELSKAICLNHQGDVYSNLSEYTRAEECYNNACILLEPMKEEALGNLLDTYLGLGNINQAKGEFSKAAIYYKICTNNKKAKSINSKAYWNARIGLANIKYIKNDFDGAKADITLILKETTAAENVDIATISLAYTNYIECLMTTGKYYEAIDMCNTAKQYIKKHSTTKNRYIADLLTLESNTYIKIGKIKEGEECMNEAIDIYQKILGKEHPNYANICIQFAHFYTLMGDFEKAERMNSEAIELMNIKFGKNHLATVNAHISKYSMHEQRAEFDKAQAELDTIKSIYKEFGIMTEYNKIKLNVKEAQLRISQGDTKKAISVLQEAVNIITQTLGKDAVQLIDIYNQMANVYLQQSENKNAKTYLDKAMALTNKIFGENSTNAAIQQMRYAEYYMSKGEYHKAYQYYINTENTVKEIFGEDNNQLCIIYRNLGDYFLNINKIDLAKQYLDKFYNITQKTYGEDHHFIAYPLLSYANYYINISEFKKGLETAKQAYEILSSLYGNTHKETLYAQLRMCMIHINLGNFDEAELILYDLSKQIIKEFGKKHWTYSSILDIQSKLYRNKGEFKKAISCIEEAKGIIEEEFGEYHFNTLSNYQSLSALNCENLNFKKAIEYNNIAIEIATKFYGDDNVGVMPFLLNKAEICIHLSKIEEAHQIFDKIKNVYTDTYGDSCIQLTPVLLLEARLLITEGYGEKAIKNLKNLEKTCLSIFDKDSPYMTWIYDALASAYVNTAQFQYAREYYQKQLDIVQKSLGRNNPNCISPLIGLADICMNEASTKQEIIEVEQLYSQAYNISTSVYGSDNAVTANIELKLGLLNLHKGNLQSAYNKFSKASTSINKYFGTEHIKSVDIDYHFGLYYIGKSKASQEADVARYYAEQALERLNRAKERNIAIYGNNNIGTAKIMIPIVETYYLLQQPDSAIMVSKASAEMQLKIYGKNSPLVANAYAMLAQTYARENLQNYIFDTEKLEKSKEYYLKAISIRNNAPGNTKEVTELSTVQWRLELSNIYAKLSDYNNALKTIDGIIEELDELSLDNKWLYFNCYTTKSGMLVEKNSIGLSINKKELEDAIRLLTKAEDLLPSLNFVNKRQKDQYTFQLQFVFGRINKMLDKKKEALQYFEKSKQIISRYPEPQTASLIQIIEQEINDLKE